MATRRTLNRRAADDARRIDQLIEQRDAARGERDAALGNTRRFAGQLSAALDELDTLRKEPAAGPVPDGWAAERRDLRRALMLSERARAALDERACAAQDANDALCREAVTRAGNLARPEVTAP